MGRVTRTRNVRRLVEATRGHAGARAVRVPLDAIAYGEHQARADEGDVDGLAESIERHGLLKPVTLRRLPAHDVERRGIGDTRCEINAGHRRFAAFHADDACGVLSRHPGGGSCRSRGAERDG